MKVEIGIDEWSPAMKKLAQNAAPAKRGAIMFAVGHELGKAIRLGIEAEKTYDGLPMLSPAKETKYNGRFSKDYNYYYPPGFRHLTPKEARVYKATGRVGTRKLGIGHGFVHGQKQEVTKIRRRIPITPSSKQLRRTGATIKSIDLISAGPDRAQVGPTTGHGNAIISYHNPTRRPFGISKEFADWANKYTASELVKGV